MLLTLRFRLSFLMSGIFLPSRYKTKDGKDGKASFLHNAKIFHK